MTPICRAFSSALLVLVWASLPAPAAAQVPTDWDTGRIQLTREDLHELLARFEQSTQSEAYTSELRARARYEATLIRSRLKEGDFQVGDQIALQVEGEPQLSNAFVVTPTRTLSLPAIGEVPLEGVLRSELQTHLTTHLGRFLRDPVVQTRSSIRVLISGAVGKPGYYVVDSQSLFSDMLMLAGGPTPTAKFTAIRVERGEQRIWDEEPLQQAIAEGRTLDQLSLRAGDHVVVPDESGGRTGTMTRLLLTGLPALALTLSTLVAIF